MQFPEITYYFPEKTLQLQSGMSIALRDEGAGRDTILFVHGLSSYIPAWDRNIPVLKEHFRTIAIDLPGYSHSQEGVFPGKMTFYAEVVAEIIEKLGLDKVTLCGHSMGGQVVLTTALEYPDLVNKLILAAPAGLEPFTGTEIRKIKSVTRPEVYYSFTDEQIRQNYEANFCKMPPEAEFMIQDRIEMKSSPNFMDYCRVVVNSLNGMLNRPVYERLEEIETETLVLFGENDALIPHPALHRGMKPGDIARIATDNMPNAMSVLFKECGHFLQFEKPREFNEAVLYFL